MYKKLLLFICVVAILHTSCDLQSPNTNKKGEDKIESHETDLTNTEISEKAEVSKTVYVPIYSSIYSKTRNQSMLLTATLSIRNTSLKYNIFIITIDYYNTKGDKVRRYLEKPIELKPLETIDYVIEEDDNEGGSGANFIVEWKAENSDVNPIIEAVMLGTFGQHGFSFLTEGVEVND